MSFCPAFNTDIYCFISNVFTVRYFVFSCSHSVNCLALAVRKHHPWHLYSSIHFCEALLKKVGQSRPTHRTFPPHEQPSRGLLTRHHNSANPCPIGCAVMRCPASARSFLTFTNSATIAHQKNPQTRTNSPLLFNSSCVHKTNIR